MKNFSDESLDGLQDLLLALEGIPAEDPGEMNVSYEEPMGGRDLRLALLQELAAPTQSRQVKSLQLDR